MDPTSKPTSEVPMHIQEAAERFELQLRANGRAQATVLQYRRLVGKFVTWLAASGHSGLVGEITDLEVARFFTSDEARYTDRGELKKPSTTNALRDAIRGFFGFLHERGDIRENPTRLLKRAVTSKPPPRGLSDIEVEKLHAALDADKTPAGVRDRVLFRTLLETGIRLSSALALVVEDVEFDAQRMRLRTTKNGSEQHVVLPARTAKILREFIGDRTRGMVFRSMHGSALSPRTAQRRFAVLRENLGLPGNVSPHSLRHTFATTLYQKTGDVLLVRQALGHRSLGAVLAYAHADPIRVRDAVG